MTKSSAGMLVFGAVAVLVGLTAWAAVVDRTLATVDKEVILQSDVMSEIAPDLNALRSQYSGEEFERRAQELLEKGLNQAVEEKILVREAKLAGIVVSDEDIEKQLETIKARYESNDAFLKDLELYGETMSDVREDVRNRVLALRMSSRKMQELSRQVSVSESEVAQYYEDHRSEFQRPERVRVRQIFLPVGPKDDRSVVRARLEQLRDEIVSGADFSELAKAHSQGPAAQDGGLVGWVAQGDLIEALDQAAFSLQPGQLSDVIETPNGMHLLKVEERQGAGQATLDDVRTKIEPLLRENAAKQRYQKWMEELRKRSRVQIFL